MGTRGSTDRHPHRWAQTGWVNVLVSQGQQGPVFIDRCLGWARQRRLRREAVHRRSPQGWLGFRLASITSATRVMASVCRPGSPPAASQGRLAELPPEHQESRHIAQSLVGGRLAPAMPHLAEVVELQSQQGQGLTAQTGATDLRLRLHQKAASLHKAADRMHDRLAAQLEFSGRQ